MVDRVLDEDFSLADEKPTPEEIMAYAEARGIKVFRVGDDVIVDNWDPVKFVAEDLYEQYLATVQQGKSSSIELASVMNGVIHYTQKTTFEDYLKTCLRDLRWRRAHVNEELARCHINLADRQRMFEFVDRQEEAIRKYLEQGRRGQNDIIMSVMPSRR